MPLQNLVTGQVLPIPPIPKTPPTGDMEKRCPGIQAWYSKMHGELDDWRKKASKAIGLPISE